MAVGLEAGIEGGGIDLDVGTIGLEISVEGGWPFVNSDVVGPSGLKHALIGVDSGGLNVGVEVALSGNVGVETGALQIGVKTGVVVGIQVRVNLVDIVPPCP